MASYSKTSTKSSLSAKVKAPKISARSSSKSPSPLTPKKSYAKNKSPAEQFGVISFGMTGLTGRD